MTTLDILYRLRNQMEQSASDSRDKRGKTSGIFMRSQAGMAIAHQKDANLVGDEIGRLLKEKALPRETSFTFVPCSRCGMVQGECRCGQEFGAEQ